MVDEITQPQITIIRSERTPTRGYLLFKPILPGRCYYRTTTPAIDPVIDVSVP
jgi:hypothetical protein